MGIEIIALIIAFFAVAVAIFQAHLGVRHNQQSVRPLLYFDTTLSDRAEHKGLSLRNEGLGPAIIVSYTIYVDDTAMSGASGGWDKAKKTLNFQSNTRTVGWLDKDDLLGTGCSIPLFLTRSGTLTTQEREQLRHELSRLIIKIKYKSLYDIEFDKEFDGSKQFVLESE